MTDAEELDVLVEGDAESDWVGIRIGKALGVAAMREDVATAVATAMRDRMGERRLPAGEVLRLAKELLGILEKPIP